MKRKVKGLQFEIDYRDICLNCANYKHCPKHGIDYKGLSVKRIISKLLRQFILEYLKAIDILMDSIDTNGEPIDFLANPILYLIRHSIELGLKYNLDYFEKYSDIIMKMEENLLQHKLN